MRALHLDRFTSFSLKNSYVAICWVRIDQRVGYELTESEGETSEPGYETSMGTKRLELRLDITSNGDVD